MSGMRATLRIAAAYSRKYASRARVLGSHRQRVLGPPSAAQQPRLLVRAARHLEQVERLVVEPLHDLQALLVVEAALAEVVRS